MTKLVIVESPAKAKTIAKYLGRGYSVTASMGHLRDLPRSTLGVDIENNFTPKYISIKGKSEYIKELAAKAKASSEVFLATDPDREGEAISWHLKEILKLKDEDVKRVTFNEITKNAVVNGVKNPRKIDENLVDAYQARRILDRIVGYQLSPLLWKKVRSGLSAGRVQSVATRLVVEREREINAFQPQEYWTILALLSADGTKAGEFRAKFFGMLENGAPKKTELHSAEDTNTILDAIDGASYMVRAVKASQKQKQPAPPFITSSLQQEASRRLGYSAKKTMLVAQSLYEGVEIGDMGLVGLITYMRTDSLRLSDESVTGTREYIAGRFGEDYLPKTPRVFKSKGNAQDAHEAIRPTMPSMAPEQVKANLNNDQFRLYKLIWERFTACQMAAAILDTVSADIETIPTAGKSAHCIFKAYGHTMRFAGFTALYEETKDTDTSQRDDDDNDDDGSAALPPLSVGDNVEHVKTTHEQKFTQPPSRYTEAMLIRALEENGIGRPSTYAPTIGTIQDRDYVTKEGKTLKPTALGEVVTKLMEDKFRDIVDVAFTVKMEQSLDEVEDGKTDWHDVIRKFYDGFSKELQTAEKELEGVKLEVPVIESDVECDLCGRKMIVKNGRFGKFLACPGYPECKNTKPIAVETPGICPKCGGKILQKKSRNKVKYYGCEKHPKCDFMTWDIPQKELCPKCGKTLFKRYNKTERKIYCGSCDYEIPVTTARGKKGAAQDEQPE